MMWTTHILLAFCWLLLFVNCDETEEENDIVNGVGDDMLWYDELFGTGLTEEIISKESKRHIASSTEDLKILYSDEQLILQTLRSETEDRICGELGSFWNLVWLNSDWRSQGGIWENLKL